jgi:hypothetical protein
MTEIEIAALAILTAVAGVNIILAGITATLLREKEWLSAFGFSGLWLHVTLWLLVMIDIIGGYLPFSALS